MKLYTEEQVKEMLSMTDMLIDGDLIPHNDIIASFTPIELPSDDDIYSILRGKKMFEKDWGFIEGAKWMREQIQKKIQKQLLSEIMQSDEKDGLYDENK